MESTTTEEPYHELRRHLPILTTVMKYLPGRELLKARLIDPYWKDAIDDALHHQEFNGESPLKHIKFSGFETCFQLFQAAFPSPNPANRFRLFHFVNLKLSLGGTPFPDLQQLLQVYCPYLKFVTIGVPSSTADNFQYVKVILNNCRVLEKLTLKPCWNGRLDSTLPQLLEPVVLGTLPSLKRLDLETLNNWNNLDKFLEDLVKSAPNFRWTSVENSYTPKTPIPAMLKYLERTCFVKLCMQLELDTNGPQLLNELGRLKLSVREFLLEVEQNDSHGSNEEIGNLISDWLDKLNRNGLQALYLVMADSCVHCPPVMNIRTLVAFPHFKKPVEPSQVPNLETVGIVTGHPNPNNVYFASGKVFPTVKKLMLHEYGCQNPELEFRFPNLESLELSEVCPKLAMEDVANMRKLFLQFPNLVRLKIDFDTPRRDLNDGAHTEVPWWDVFTGGILPRMNRQTKLEVIYAKGLQIGRVDLEGVVTPAAPSPSVFELLPNLRRLELLDNCPEVLVYAIIHLTATEIMPRLETLRFGQVEGSYKFRKEFPEIKYFLPMLNAHHDSVILI